MKLDADFKIFDYFLELIITLLILVITKSKRRDSCMFNYIFARSFNSRVKDPIIVTI